MFILYIFYLQYDGYPGGGPGDMVGHSAAAAAAAAMYDPHSARMPALPGSSAQSPGAQSGYPPAPHTGLGSRPYPTFSSASSSLPPVPVTSEAMSGGGGDNPLKRDKDSVYG